MTNTVIADIFQNIADLLELQDADRFRVVSYQRASRTIRSYGKELSELYHEDPTKILAIPGIGKTLSERIAEIINTGTCAYYYELLDKIEPGLLGIMQLRDIGPKKTKFFYKELGIGSVDELKKAAEKGELQGLPGMGERSEQKILQSIEDRDSNQKRMLLDEALVTAENITKYIKLHKACKQLSHAGSLRRHKETVGDFDILVTSTTKKGEKELAEHFLAYPAIQRVLAHGKTKISVLLTTGRQADLRILDTKSFGAALHYFTGSKEHNIHIRKRAHDRGLKINEYGVYKGSRWVAGRTEKEVFAKAGLPYIEPELREDQGEIETAEKGTLPKLIRLEDLRGDLQVHSNESDGDSTIDEMAKAAKAYGLEYIAITDHARTLRIANGLNEKRLEEQFKKIDALNKKLTDFCVLKSSEVNINKDGSLDIADKTLAKMDLVLAATHSSPSLAKEQQTRRIIKAIEHPMVNILGHPTGRLLNQRKEMEFDIEQVIKAAVLNNVALEINAQPQRLDLSDRHIRLAKELGAKFTISTDGHSIGSFSYLFFGVVTARRGWLEKRHVLNTMSVDKLLAYFGKKTK